MSEEQNWNDLQHLCRLFRFVCVSFSFRSDCIHSQSSCRVQVVAPSHRSTVKVLIAVTADFLFFFFFSCCMCLCVFVCVCVWVGVDWLDYWGRENIVNSYSLAQIWSFPCCPSRTNTVVYHCSYSQERFTSARVEAWILNFLLPHKSRVYA